mmetsp:Transcript_9613/g.22078  ORF Transcript_9613/g.22078 Transcript_9613/m.22078 type:complete len:381 (+) Transcript_9613:92-1234(+)
MFGFGCCRSARPASSSGKRSSVPNGTDDDDNGILGPQRKPISELRRGSVKTGSTSSWWHEEILADKMNSDAEFEERERRRSLARLAFSEERERRARETEAAKAGEREARLKEKDLVSRAEENERLRRLNIDRRLESEEEFLRGEERRRLAELAHAEREERQRQAHSEVETEKHRRRLKILAELRGRSGVTGDNDDDESRELGGGLPLESRGQTSGFGFGVTAPSDHTKRLVPSVEHDEQTRPSSHKSRSHQDTWYGVYGSPRSRQTQIDDRQSVSPTVSSSVDDSAHGGDERSRVLPQGSANPKWWLSSAATETEAFERELQLGFGDSETAIRQQAVAIKHELNAARTQNGATNARRRAQEEFIAAKLKELGLRPLPTQA